MDFSTVPDNNYTFEQVCSCLKASILISSAMKSSMTSVADVPVPKGLSVNIALQLFYKMGAASISLESHPVVKLEKVLAVTEIKLTPTKIDAVVDRVPVELSLTRGYFVEKRNGPEPLMASLSDAMAYVYTSSTPGSQPICDSNFRSGNPTAAIPVIKTSVPLNVDWKKSKAYENSIATYDKLSLNKSTVFVAQSSLIKILKEAAPKKEVEVFIPPPPSYVGPTVIRDGKTAIAVSKPFVPGIQHIKSIAEVYRYLSVHRMARGEDNKWISPLTSGYYYGSMSRAMDKLTWKVADMLHVLRLTNVSAIYFMALPSMSVCQSLAANGIVVFTVTTGPATAPFVMGDKGNILPGVYRVRSLQDLNFQYILVPESLSTTRPVYKTSGVVYPDEDKYHSYLSEVYRQHNCVVLATCFLTPKLLENKEVTLIPSIHAHSGHVLALFGTKFNDPVDRALLIDRICTSNIFKTWFPLSRVRYFEYDLLAYKFANYGLENMILSVHTKKTKTASVDFGPFDSTELAETMAQTVGDQTFVCNSLWTTIAQGNNSPQTMTYQEHPQPAPTVPIDIDPVHVARPPDTAPAIAVASPAENFDMQVTDF